MINIVAWARLDALAEKADFLDGFFKIIGKIVDKGLYPVFFDEFYLKGEVPNLNCPKLLAEVELIEQVLMKQKVNIKLVEQEPDILKVENYKKYLNIKATNMADLFLNPNNESLFEVFKFNIDYAIKKNAPILIKYYAM
jgi:hypothetical protein